MGEGDAQVLPPPAANQLAPARISAAELAQLRRGQLDRQSVEAWEKRAWGLAAPLPPPEGPLPANGTGWLLDTSRIAHAVHGRLVWWRDRAMFLAYLGWYLVATGASSGAWALGLGIGALGLPAVGGLVARLTARRRMKRWLEVVPPAVALANTPPGTPVRIVGTIVAPATIPSLFRGLPAVLCRNTLGNADETRGIDFSIMLDDGQRIMVDVRRALLLDPPTVVREMPACGPVAAEALAALDPLPRLVSTLHRPASLLDRIRPSELGEASVGPGDRVEIVGLLHHEVAPNGVAIAGRRPPIGQVLRSGAARPLLVRRAQVRPARLPVPP